MFSFYRISLIRDYNQEVLELENKFQEDQIQIIHQGLKELPVVIDLLKV